MQMFPTADPPNFINMLKKFVTSFLVTLKTHTHKTMLNVDQSRFSNQSGWQVGKQGKVLLALLSCYFFARYTEIQSQFCHPIHSCETE